MFFNIRTQICILHIPNHAQHPIDLKIISTRIHSHAFLGKQIPDLALWAEKTCESAAIPAPVFHQFRPGSADCPIPPALYPRTGSLPVFLPSATSRPHIMPIWGPIQQIRKFKRKIACSIDRPRTNAGHLGASHAPLFRSGILCIPGRDEDKVTTASTTVAYADTAASRR